ncbi:MAG: glutamate--tRNA ligase [Deltaproteobacteria bacterium]|nr:glutamate--tRNA ligase [Deltaproteobacteria bacterium]
MFEVRTRFSPSPTGSLHLGGAHTALFNWLIARHFHGAFILRIEDTDRERSRQEYVDEILEAMHWLGLDWDEGPYYQTERLAIYREYIDRLLAKGAAYYCDCSLEDLKTRREAALARGDKPKYDGRCRSRNLGPGPNTVVRFRGPDAGVTRWDDLIKGPIAFDNQELDDLVILRSDGLPTYNFAVVVDDLSMGVTQIIRGEDHIPNTPRQILIYQALGAELPRFAHMPLMLAPDRGKLSKRRGARPVLDYREQGILPQSLCNYLARLGWSHGDQEIFTRDELVQYFTLEHATSSPGVFDEEKLLWINSQHLKALPAPELARQLTPFLAKAGIGEPDLGYLTRVVPTLSARCRTLAEMAEAARFYFQDPRPYEEKGAKKFLTPANVLTLRQVAVRLEAMPEFNEEALNQLFHDLAAETGLKMVNLAQPVRLALTGRTASPGLYEIIDILGKPETLKRIEHALVFAEGDQ